MTADEVRQVVAEVLSEQGRLHNADVDTVVLKTISTILTGFGIEEDDRIELRADFQHLRKWRKSVEQAQSYTFKAVITVIVSGFVGAVWLGIKATLMVPSIYVGNAGYFCRVGVLQEHCGHRLQLRLMRALERRARRNGWSSVVSELVAAIWTGR